MTKASLLAQQRTKACDQETWPSRQSHPVIHRADRGVNSRWRQQPLNAPLARFLTSLQSFVQPVCSFLFQPTGKGPRLPEVYCVISRLGCFDLFSTVSSACPTKSHPVDTHADRQTRPGKLCIVTEVNLFHNSRRGVC